MKQLSFTHVQYLNRAGMLGILILISALGGYIVSSARHAITEKMMATLRIQNEFSNLNLGFMEVKVKFIEMVHSKTVEPSEIKRRLDQIRLWLVEAKASSQQNQHGDRILKSLDVLVREERRVRTVLYAYVGNDYGDPARDNAMATMRQLTKSIDSAVRTALSVKEQMKNEVRLITVELHDSLKLAGVWLLFALFAGCSAILILGWWQGGRLRALLDELNHATEQIAHGNLSYRINAIHTDALGKVAANIDQMAQSLSASETSLHQAVQHAEAASQAKSDFLANMSHELRTPLHAILSYSRYGGCEIISADKPTLLKYFTNIQKSGNRLLKLLDNLLDLSKLAAAKRQFNKGPSDLYEIACGVMDELFPLARSSHIRIELRKPAFEAIVNVDHDAISQVFMNILANAIKFSPASGQIDLVFTPFLLDRTQTLMDSVLFTVADQGVGIPPEELTTIFDPFVQSSRTQSGAGGSGLGLAICREIVNAHGGRIWAENKSAGGALFLVVLPRRNSLGER